MLRPPLRNNLPKAFSIRKHRRGEDLDTVERISWTRPWRRPNHHLTTVARLWGAECCGSRCSPRCRASLPSAQRCETAGAPHSRRLQAASEPGREPERERRRRRRRARVAPPVTTRLGATRVARCARVRSPANGCSEAHEHRSTFYGGSLQYLSTTRSIRYCAVRIGPTMSPCRSATDHLGARRDAPRLPGRAHLSTNKGQERHWRDVDCARCSIGF